jgi:two-component system nitrogen regulation sensor histidine kinase GlnL
MSAPGVLDALTTPVAWAAADATLAGANPAFARWLGVGARRLPGLPLAALEADGERLARWLAAPGDDAVRLRRLSLAFPGGAPRFADLALSPREGGGWWIEAHPVDEFPGEDPVQALPAPRSGWTTTRSASSPR